ncbi:hypothetical protein CUMW_181660 [Citrus unshiu]|uniref:Pectinesterase inhibitor domain-containing protein n=1 Tax=Citrus unshiu TaxID=55188 RepID=A0A2H5Q099_CITUN|nr:hypothetical protein CUMW_181660 [Citrus unshiu]
MKSVVILMFVVAMVQVMNLKTITPTTVDIQAACDCVKVVILKVENEVEPRSTHVGIQATKEDVCTSKVM